MKKPRIKTQKSVKSSVDVYSYLKDKMRLLDREHFLVLYMDSKNRIIKKETVAIGTLNACLVHPREVFKNAIINSANAIIVVHNHPSGDSQPSDQDTEITKNLQKAGKIIGINVLDHIIIGEDNYYGFAEERPEIWN